MFEDRMFRTARLWSNRELAHLAPLFKGDVVNVSAWDDRDKAGGHYIDYFSAASNYFCTNYSGYRGFENRSQEFFLDLTGTVPEPMKQRFDVAFNHTTLEHIFDVQTAFKNLCDLTKDVAMVIVPFAQVQHETETYKDFWRFSPTCLRHLFAENGMQVVYESESPLRNAAVYVMAVGSRHPERWQNKFPPYTEISEAAGWLGSNRLATGLGRLLHHRRSNKTVRPQGRRSFGLRKRNKTRDFETTTSGEGGPSLKRRKYDSYAEYVEHQGEKLGRRRERIEESDRDYESIVRARYLSLPELKGKTVLCMGARLGGEVRAFKSLGALAIGIDIQPGPENPHVMYGDFHNISFPDDSFDFVFTNALDHVYELNRVVDEAHRVLRPGGALLIELAVVKPSEYEVLDTSNPAPILNVLGTRFQLESADDLRNTTDFIDWPGYVYCFRKPAAPADIRCPPAFRQAG